MPDRRLIFDFLEKTMIRLMVLLYVPPMTPTITNYFMDIVPEGEKLGIVSWWKYGDETFVLLRYHRVH